MKLPSLRTAAIIGSFGTVAALCFAGALIMVGVAQIVEAVGCAMDSEREE